MTFWVLGDRQPGEVRGIRRRRRHLVLCDAVVSLVTLSCVVFLAERSGVAALHSARPLLAIGISWSTFLLGLCAFHVYGDSQRGLYSLKGDYVRRLAHATLFALLAIFGFEAIAGEPVLRRVAPLAVAMAFLATFLSVLLARRVITKLLRTRGVGGDRVIVVGSGGLANDVLLRLKRSPDFIALGLVDDRRTPERHVLGPTCELPELCSELGANRVIVAFSRRRPEELVPVLRSLPREVAVDIVPRYFELTGWGSQIEDFSGLPLVAVPPKSEPARLDGLKRAFDVSVALLVLVLVSPVLLLAGLAIRCTTRGPVFFHQVRLGRNRVPFHIHKLRTLKPEPASESEQTADVPVSAQAALPTVHTDRLAARVTPIGKLLRRTGIDELPQLFNVLAGQMSLVGPRPFVPEECGILAGRAERRFDVRPGMTGLWQVSGQHNLPIDELVRLDLHYVDSWTLRSDLRILAKTPSRLLRGGGDGMAQRVLEPVGPVSPPVPGSLLS